MSLWKPLAAAFIVTVALLGAGQSAVAAVRYTAPGASGAEPCSPTPCALAKAVNAAKAGDRVVMAPGEYAVTSEIEISQPIDIGPEAGVARPVVGLVERQWVVNNAGAVVHDLKLTETKEAMAYALTLRSGTVERVIADPQHKGGGCSVEGGTLRDSLCPEGLNVFATEPGTQKVTLRNVTAIPLLIGASPGSSLSLDAASVIAHSISQNKDLEVDVSSGGSMAATFTHSNYATVATTLSTGTDFTFTAPGTNGNQTAPPQFVDAAGGDFRVLESSPTVDAGLSDALIGSLDLAGQPRSLPKCIGGTPIPDIGAYEFVPTVACPKPSNAFKLGKLKRNPHKGTAKLTVILPGPGTLALAGKGLLTRKPRQVKAGKTTLAIAAKGKWKRALQRTGKVTLRARVTFTPTGGDARTVTKKVMLALRIPG